MSSKIAQDLASRLAKVALRLTSWAAAPPRDGGGTDEEFLDRLEDAIREVDAAVGDVVEPAAVPAPRGGPRERPRRPAKRQESWNDLDDTLEGIQGHSRAFTIPELLSFVAASYKTGILRVDAEEESFLVQLENGWVVLARSDRPVEEEQLGSILVAEGMVSAEDLDSLRGTGPLLVEKMTLRLLERGLVSAEDLERALSRQVYAIFRRLSMARDAHFRFYEGARLEHVPEVRLNINKLLLESVRTSDELAERERAKRASNPSVGPREQAPMPEAEQVSVAVADGPGKVDAEEVDPFRAELGSAIAEERVELPLLDLSASQLLVLCWDEGLDAGTLVDHIGRDQGLSAHVLRAANSAAFAPVVPVDSVKLAVARLGINRIREIALALTIRHKAFEVPGWDLEVRALWRRSVVTSGFAKAIYRRVANLPQRGAVLGLLQDIGKPVVLNALCEIEAEHGVELDRSHARNLMEDYHAEIGAMLAKHWSLPEWLHVVLRNHHEPSGEDPGEEARRDLHVARLADRLASWAEDRDQDPFAALAELESRRALSLSDEDLVGLLAETDSIVAQAEVYA